jgi:hypothetical protein
MQMAGSQMFSRLNGGIVYNIDKFAFSASTNRLFNSGIKTTFLIKGREINGPFKQTRDSLTIGYKTHENAGLMVSFSRIGIRTKVFNNIQRNHFYTASVGGFVFLNKFTNLFFTYTPKTLSTQPKPNEFITFGVNVFLF